MKLKVLVVLWALVAANIASAQSVESDLIGLGMEPQLSEYIAGILPSGSVLGNDTYLKGRNAAGSADISVLKVDGTDDTVLNADAGDVIKLAVANTPIAALGSVSANGFALMKVVGDSTLGGDAVFASGKGPVIAPYVVTAAATPAAGSNDITGKVSVFPTAAANTAALLKATPVVGDEYTIFNSGPNAVRVKAGGAATINGSAAGAYIPLATQAAVRCIATTGTAWACGYLAVPTPAGP